MPAGGDFENTRQRTGEAASWLEVAEAPHAGDRRIQTCQDGESCLNMWGLRDAEWPHVTVRGDMLCFKLLPLAHTCFLFFFILN